jgi:hypothetical protein
MEFLDKNRKLIPLSEVKAKATASVVAGVVGKQHPTFLNNLD